MKSKLGCGVSARGAGWGLGATGALKFTNSKARQRVFNARKSFGKWLFILDSLTTFRSLLSFEARALKRDHKLTSTWVAGGNIYGLMVLNGHERKDQIKDLDAIDAICNGMEPSYHPLALP
ncbi:hypothetical protein DPMN_042974 [Dreissena polymorpha]|uniref:Uncharacterized protein n=1 Tax=Dreissena polymorpha TaxID=45954 RepID=A0A9D4CZL1_DREPO|nr:hypothetical protein DPMN_042974 [Dreissena polymorpha]